MDEGDDFEKRRFAGSIRADDAYPLPFFDREVHVFECPE